ncbi:MAG: DUF2589 domain-containing protein [Bacteroidales bacterium]|nr:DUF2589 domain-containing protein [Bacteroidales bacterium]
MVKYRAASNAATSALKSIPFENIIGAPLEACIRAQQSAAQSTVDFINAVGLQEVTTKDEEGNESTRVEAIYVSFQFIQGGRMVQMNVPLLSIVPIPYIAINTIDINFKANITAATTNTAEDSSTEDKTKKEDYAHTHKYNGWRVKNTSSSNISAQVSSKKDSKATQESKYSVEYTIDVAVHASQDSMPAGMAKVLEMIGTAMDLCSADGEIYVNGTQFEAAAGGNAMLEVSYKTPAGLIDNKSIQVNEYNPNTQAIGEVVQVKNKTRDAVYFELSAGDAGKSYIVKSSENPDNQEIITVSVTQAVVPATGGQQPAEETK